MKPLLFAWDNVKHVKELKLSSFFKEITILHGPITSDLAEANLVLHLLSKYLTRAQGVPGAMVGMLQ